MQYLYLGLAIVLEIIATSALTSSQGFTKLSPSLVSLTGYAFAFYFLSLTLLTMPVGIAYAIWSGVGIILISLIGVFYFGQKLDLAAILGIILITAGVFVINLFSETNIR